MRTYGVYRPSRRRHQRSGDIGPDPYAPGSHAYEDRHRETVTQLPGGLTRIDLGEPIPGVRADQGKNPK